MITQTRLKELLYYDEENDQFISLLKTKSRAVGDLINMKQPKLGLDGSKYSITRLKSLYLTGIYEQLIVGKLVTYDELIQLLEYDKFTGIFTWLVDRKGTAVKGSIAGCKDGNGYIVITLGGTRYYAHRLAWLYSTGEWPINEIDHEDRCTSNNILSNLSDVTTRENSYNQESVGNIIGVTKRLGNKEFPWVARIHYNGEKIHLGCFKTDELAGAAYSKALALVKLNRHPTKDKDESTL